jgi:thioredoxin-related protein
MTSISKRIIIFSLPVLIGLFSAFIWQHQAPKEIKKETPPLVWHTYSEGAALAAKQNKKMIIDVYTDWCHWCKVMDQKTFSDPKVSEYMSKHFIAVKLNAEKAEKVLYKKVPLSSKEFAGSVLKVNSYPSTVFFDPLETNISGPVEGYLDAPTMLKILTFFKEDQYKTKTWEQFGVEYDARKSE